MSWLCEDCRTAVETSTFSNKAFGWNKGYFVTMNNSQPRTSLRAHKECSLCKCTQGRQSYLHTRCTYTFTVAAEVTMEMNNDCMYMYLLKRAILLAKILGVNIEFTLCEFKVQYTMHATDTLEHSQCVNVYDFCLSRSPTT